MSAIAAMLSRDPTICEIPSEVLKMAADMLAN